MRIALKFNTRIYGQNATTSTIAKPSRTKRQTAETEKPNGIASPRRNAQSLTDQAVGRSFGQSVQIAPLLQQQKTTRKSSCSKKETLSAMAMAKCDG